MPKRQDIKKIMILGSGPIVIGQACEFDYSGTQACKALMNEGYEVVLVNSNPATIMTDPEVATRTYIEPLEVPYLKAVIEKERPDALIPTLGGQTALNAALALDKAQVLQEFSVKLLGTSADIIRRAEDRSLFSELVREVGGRTTRSYMVKSFEDGVEKGQLLGMPIILRPNYTLGGGGGGIAYSLDEYREMLQRALSESPTNEVQVEESILGWKEFELEIMRDARGTFVVVCSIENIDPCGVHTGDSVTVAPQQTLSDFHYQDMRDEARRITEAVGIETGGANIQFAVHPDSHERVVIEMNPRVSRSSALASKATGFPIAKIAALVAVGYHLDEITNDITGTTPCCYEPALDYVVVKIPKFNFEKFAGVKDQLTTQMKSVGEVMGIGRTFCEAFMKATESLENREIIKPGEADLSEDKLAYPSSKRLFYLFEALRSGWSIARIYELTQITPWYLDQFQRIMEVERELSSTSQLDEELLRRAKRFGYSDALIADITKLSEEEVLRQRKSLNIEPAFYRVDTCAGEFESTTPYFYSTYWGNRISFSEMAPSFVSASAPITVIGSGPNRIGQGIEFDYSCVRGVWSLRRRGHQVVMINSNPETVSTDYDTANYLFFEPLTSERVAAVMGWIGSRKFVAQWGGQTSISLASPLTQMGHEILGSSVEAMDRAEDRSQFVTLCREYGFKIPEAKTADTFEGAQRAVSQIGFPVVCRPSFVLGGRRMEVVENESDLERYFERHGHVVSERNPILIDEFLAGALEVDVDLVCGGNWQVIGGVVEHIEAAGVHSGDSMGVLPPQRLKPETLARVEQMSAELGSRLGVIGHLNLQLAIKKDEVYLLEANPRSSRSAPFVSKATGLRLVDLAVGAMMGESRPNIPDWKNMKDVCVKGVVLPFKKFSEADSILGPEMKSTGESMGRGKDYSEALLKACISSQMRLPKPGEVFCSVRDKDKAFFLPLVKQLRELGFTFSATSGTASFLAANDIEVENIRRVREGRPHCVDRIRSGSVVLVFNTTSGRQSIEDSFSIRRSCIDFFIPCITESDAAEAFVMAIKRSFNNEVSVSSLQ
ncbi:MAG: carbamoyl phosphate synthase large subunit [Bdellovibrionales bacterium CG10_big_fil_rev_8_21_14_0_10_45_34]|nr:MAG: carbamoyl phosphate synthase large subunit [Bdellovibrionales bacterium CG10_big_fil_rev_8_21_14_0_10_45_34]